MQRMLVFTAGLILITLGASAAWLAARSGVSRSVDGTGAAEAPSVVRPPWSTRAVPQMTPGETAPSAVGSDATASAEHADTREGHTPTEDHRQIVGTWQDGYRGRRTMTVRADGTATMVCELEGLNARLFTPVLHLNLHWQLVDGVMTRLIVDGEPADKVRFVINLMGARSDEKLLRLTDGELHLLDGDGKTEYRWTRVLPTGSDSSSP